MRRLLGAAVGATAVLFLLAWAATPLPHAVRVAAIDILWLTGAVVAGIACLWARRRPDNAHLRRPLGLFAVAAFVWAAGQAVWTFQEVVQHVDAPVFALADIGYWSAVLLQSAGILAWPRDRIAWQLGTVLDLMLITGFALLFGFEFMLRPLLEDDLDGLGLATAVLYPPGEVLLFGSVVAALLLRHWRDRGRLELLAAGLLLSVVADAGYSYLGDAYSTGGWLDPLWAAGFAAIGLAALAPADWRERRGWISERAVAVAPSVALGAVALLGIVVALAGRAPLGAAERIAIFSLVLLLSARQAYTQLRLLVQMAEQRRLEQELQHAQRLEAVGRLAGGVAHDFNNLLTAIDGYSDLALNQLAGHHPARRDIDEVRRAAQRAADLTRQLLAFSRRQVLAPQVVDVNVVVADIERLLRRLTGDAVELELELAAGRALVLADPGQLEQVITNLVVNARDAMPDGGAVTLATTVSDGRVRLSVSDTGVGMSEEVQARLFEPFFTTKETGKGTGLGLAMVHGIVTQSNGEIHVTSVPGEGARFDIDLPAAAAPTADAAGEATVREPVSCSGKVLLVEDEPAVRDLTRRMLELAGYDVVTVSSGEEALELHDGAAGFDVLVTDVVMPGINGHELAGRLREARPELAVVLMSGYSQSAEAIEGLRAAGAAFVEKPFTSRELVDEVRGVLEAA